MHSITLSSGIKLSFQDEGDKKKPTIILIMGLGAQMTVWPDNFYYGLIEKGFRVIRFDNRDVGKSSKLTELGSPSLLNTWLSKYMPLPTKAPYLLDDMANDVLQLMDALGVKKAHLVGSSMGGMIAQILAANHRKRIISLTSIMSSPNASNFSASNLKLFLLLAKRPSQFNREAAINYNVKLNRLIGSPAYPSDDNYLYQQATFHVDRSYHPAGVKRQLVAITASGCRKQLLKRIKAKTLVIHGSDDPVIPVSQGHETARSIKKTKLKIVKGMGHDFPPILMAKLTKWIAKHIDKAERKHQQKLQKKRPEKCLQTTQAKKRTDLRT
ncbi:alpha/beta fold hydrolase [Thalassotalea sp. PLHSN55]|uniref:alpha/beta fold hydrolase n=1 Tax=Thalassotalea sp. PLHSN55 TaxID=3435888 RepID=UPI003F848D10